MAHVWARCCCIRAPLASNGTQGWRRHRRHSRMPLRLAIQLHHMRSAKPSATRPHPWGASRRRAAVQSESRGAPTQTAGSSRSCWAAPACRWGCPSRCSGRHGSRGVCRKQADEWREVRVPRGAGQVSSRPELAQRVHAPSSTQLSSPDGEELKVGGGALLGLGPLVHLSRRGNTRSATAEPTLVHEQAGPPTCLSRCTARCKPSAAATRAAATTRPAERTCTAR